MKPTMKELVLTMKQVKYKYKGFKIVLNTRVLNIAQNLKWSIQEKKPPPIILYT